MPYRIGIDIGGTFTDLVLIDDRTGALALYKTLTTPHNPAEGALAGLRGLLGQAGAPIAEVDAIIHGTTLVTNAIIERRGAPTALLTTQGFRDLLEMGREQRYDIYDLFLRFPEPLVPRRLRYELPERMDRDGRTVTPPDLAAAQAIARELAGQGVEALAIGFLHAYANPAHERAVAAAIRAAAPQLALSLSSEVAPEVREYERLSTTAANAYVQPLIDRYLGDLEAALAAAGFRGRLLLMHSAGGTVAPATARRLPIRLLESGPAGGAAFTAFIAGRLAPRLADPPQLLTRDEGPATTSNLPSRLPHSQGSTPAPGSPLASNESAERSHPQADRARSGLLAFDMGGTTAKACLVREGRAELLTALEAARVQRFQRGSGLPIRTPVVALIEIGAGGGSIARADSLGLLRVGPDSAGADPGPACYGRGGEQPTVTDACLALGYLDPAYFLGGRMPLHPQAADAALDRLGAQLGLSRQAAAWGIHQVVCATMADAARVHLIEQGHDPRRFPMLAFGGAGPLHAAQVARALGLRTVVVPPAPGVASALGFHVAPISLELVRSAPADLPAIDWPAVARLYDELEGQARQDLIAAGVEPSAATIARRADMRLSGQFHEIAVPVPPGPLTESAGAALAEAFAAEYRRRYQILPAGYTPMVLSWRLHASGPAIDPQTIRLIPPETPGAPDQFTYGRSVLRPLLPKTTRPAAFGPAGAVPTPVYDRYRLPPGARIAGPAIVEERESTTILPPGATLEVDALGCLWIAVNGGR